MWHAFLESRINYFSGLERQNQTKHRKNYCLQINLSGRPGRARNHSNSSPDVCGQLLGSRPGAPHLSGPPVQGYVSHSTRRPRGQSAGRTRGGMGALNGRHTSTLLSWSICTWGQHPSVCWMGGSQGSQDGPAGQEPIAWAIK